MDLSRSGRYIKQSDGSWKPVETDSDAVWMLKAFVFAGSLLVLAAVAMLIYARYIL